MIDIIFKAFFLMIPAYIANMMPVIIKKIKFLGIPVDFNIKLNNKPLFGSHKTWRGIFFGTIGGIIAAYIQFILIKHGFFKSIALLDYAEWLTIGLILGFGALLGDLIKSFFKRRMNIKPGAKFIPWDQIDYSIGSLILLLIMYTPPISLIFTVLILNFFLHVTANHIAFYLGISKVKW